MNKVCDAKRAGIVVSELSNFVAQGLQKSAFGMMFCAITIPLTQAQIIKFSVNTGYERYYYEEPGMMQLSGDQYVVGGRVLVKFDAGNALIVEGRYAGAEVDYVSPRSGSSPGQALSINEFRLLGERTYKRSNLEFRPFAGIGMRRLSNDAQGLTTTNGDIGYLRVITYKYLPFGVNVVVGS